MASSSQSMTETSPWLRQAAAAARRTAQRNTALALRRAFHSGDSTLISMMTAEVDRDTAGRMRALGAAGFIKFKSN